MVEDNQLRSIRVQFNRPNEWLSPEIDRVGLPHVLAHMGTLPEIYITGTSTDLALDMHVIYPNEGVWIWYRFNLLDSSLDQTPSLCFNTEQTELIDMVLYEPDDEEMVTRYTNFRDSPQLTLYSVEDLYGIDLNTFVQFFKDNPEGCLEQPHSRQ